MPVPWRSRDPAAGPIVAGAVALPLEHAARDKEALAGGVLARAVVGEVGGAPGDRGEWGGEGRGEVAG